MDVTFHPVFKTNTMVGGLWHEVAGQIRYEATHGRGCGRQLNSATCFQFLIPNVLTMMTLHQPNKIVLDKFSNI